MSIQPDRDLVYSLENNTRVTYNSNGVMLARTFHNNFETGTPDEHHYSDCLTYGITFHSLDEEDDHIVVEDVAIKINRKRLTCITEYKSFVYIEICRTFTCEDNLKSGTRIYDKNNNWVSIVTKSRGDDYIITNHSNFSTTIGKGDKSVYYHDKGNFFYFMCGYLGMTKAECFANPPIPGIHIIYKSDSRNQIQVVSTIIERNEHYEGLLADTFHSTGTKKLKNTTKARIRTTVLHCRGWILQGSYRWPKSVYW